MCVQMLCAWPIDSEEQQHLAFPTEPLRKAKYKPRELFFQPFHHFLLWRRHPLAAAVTSLSHHLASDRWFLFRKSGHRPQSTTALLTGPNRKVWQRWGKKKKKHTHTRLYIGVRPAAKQFGREALDCLPSAHQSGALVQRSSGRLAGRQEAEKAKCLEAWAAGSSGAKYTRWWMERSGSQQAAASAPKLLR